jgi:polysaccharide export outer membrane protein
MRATTLTTWLWLTMLLGAAGCAATRPSHHQAAVDALPPPADMPKELQKVALPSYTIEPPDILVIEALYMVPRSPYALRSGDLVAINVTGTLPDFPISGRYPVQPGGIIDLGTPYGIVVVRGMTTDQAKVAIETALREQLRMPSVTMSLIDVIGSQQVAGQHLVGPDGTVTLGTYGSVPVVGLTIPQAKATIERRLSEFLEDPQIAVDVYAYNSKVYYVITEGAGTGDGVSRFPITGNETVLDAIANINGLSQVSSKQIWIARPVPGCDQVQVLNVDWKAITATGCTATNYQIMPGDRIFVREDCLVAFDTNLAKLLAPAERAMGFALLGVGTVTRFSGKVLRGGGYQNNNGFGAGGFN